MINLELKRTSINLSDDMKAQFDIITLLKLIFLKSLYFKLTIDINYLSSENFIFENCIDLCQ